jgi:hypothetical protein
LKRLSRLLQKALSATEALFAIVAPRNAWVERAAAILDNPHALPGYVVRWAYQGFLADLACVCRQPGVDPQVQSAAHHFLKVSQSYGAGLFHCYDQADLPRTNNDLEQYFGAYRYHQRRASGRKVGGASMVLRGSVRLVACAVTRHRPVPAEDLGPHSLEDWRKLRRQLEQRQETRRQQRRFRRDPDAYLAAVEERLLMSTLPT